MQAASIYSLSDDLVYIRNDASAPFAYSDGDDCEGYIWQCIRSAKDVSSSSAELPGFIRDWPTRYHLSSRRADLVRPFQGFFSNKHILEIGAGCGAITRFLGEAGAHVTALEGSYRRACITAARCRDLDNVQVVCDNFSQFETTEKYDVITLVGVLEYAHLFSDKGDAAHALLQRTASLLKPSGVLLVAIENKLGLKYLAGAPEDHSGNAYDGIENRYDERSATTYGKAELGALLGASGYLHREFFYPFPDYKFPSVVLRDAVFDMPGFDVVNLVAPAIDYVQGQSYVPAFSLERAAQEVIHNQLMAELSNSFLIIASQSSTSITDADTLAYSFSSDRKAVYRKQNSFVLRNDDIEVKRKSLYPHLLTEPHLFLSQHITDEPYYSGRLLSLGLHDIISTPGWDVQGLVRWVQPFYDLLKSLAFQQDGQLWLEGRYIDITPSNMIYDGQRWHFFDQEWEVNEPVPLSFVLFRGLYYSFAQPRHWQAAAPDTPLYVFGLIRAVCNGLFEGPEGMEEDFVRLEARYFGHTGGATLYRPFDFRLPVLSGAVTKASSSTGASFVPLTMVTCKLFFQSDEGGFSEAGSIREVFHLSPERQSYSIPVRNHTARIEQIRIDPAEQPGVLKLFSIHIIEVTGRSLWEWHAADSSEAESPVRFSNIVMLDGGPATDHVFLLCVSDDPMIIIDLPASLDSQAFDVHIELAALASTANGTETVSTALLSSFVQLQGNDAGEGGIASGEQGNDEVLSAYTHWLQDRFTEPLYASLADQEQQIADLQGQIHLLSQQLDNIRAEKAVLVNHVDWYHRTYEKRSLGGVMKSRIAQSMRHGWQWMMNGLLATHFIRRKHVVSYLLEYGRTHGPRQSLSALRGVFRQHGWQTFSHARGLCIANMRAQHTVSLPTPSVSLFPVFDAEAARKAMGQWKEFPLFSIIIPTYNTKPELLLKAIASVERQVYPHWEICIADDCSSSASTQRLLRSLASRERIHVKLFPAHVGISIASNAAIQMASGDYIALLDHDDELTPDALFEVAQSINTDGDADIIYSDECKVDETGQLSDFFLKPDWSPELLFNMMYVGHLTVYRKVFLDHKVGHFRSAYDFSQDYDLMLRATQATNLIRHIPKILYYWRITAGSATAGDKPYARVSNLAALGDAIKERGIDGEIIELPVANRVKLQPAVLPMVSLVIPTDSFDNLSAAIDSIVGGTDYSQYEVVVVTNSGLIGRMQALYNNEMLRYVAYDRPYNFSDKCNVGAAHAQGEVVIFFNDDVRPLQPDWIQNTIEFLFVPGVGGVSPKLVYENDTIQYAGMITGVRNLTGTSFHCLPKDSLAYFNFPQLVRNVSILSGACVALRKDVFQAIGGFDAVHTPSSHSDVDLSFKLLERGLRCVYTPYATLRHIGHLSLEAHERAEKKFKKDKSDIYLLKRWPQYVSYDPYFSASMRNLLYHDSPEPFSIHVPSVLSRPGNKGDVLAVSHDLSLSGAPIMLYYGCRLLLEAGYYVVVVSPTDGPVRAMYQAAGIPVICDELALRRHPSFFKFAKNFDLLICNTAICWPVVGQLQDVVKTCWWVHEAQVLSLLAQDTGFVRTLQQAYNLLTPSAYAAGFIKRYNEQVEIIHYGCDDVFYPPVERTERNNKVIVSIVGSIEARKGQDILLRSLDFIDSSLLDKMELWIVGRTHDAAFKAALDRQTGGRAFIRYTGEVSHAESMDIMRQSDVIVSASRDDPFPVVLVEAFCLGKACVISSHTGVCELVEDGVNGFVFPNEDFRALANKLSLLLVNPGLIQMAGQEARRTYESFLTMSLFSEQWLHYLDSLRIGKSFSTSSKQKMVVHGAGA